MLEESTGEAGMEEPAGSTCRAIESFPAREGRDGAHIPDFGRPAGHPGGSFAANDHYLYL